MKILGALTLTLAIGALTACDPAPLSPISVDVESPSPAPEPARFVLAAPVGEFQSQCTPDGTTWFLLAPADGANAVFYLVDGGSEATAGQRILAPANSNDGFAYVDGGERTQVVRPEGCGVTS